MAAAVGADGLLGATVMADGVGAVATNERIGGMNRGWMSVTGAWLFLSISRILKPLGTYSTRRCLSAKKIERLTQMLGCNKQQQSPKRPSTIIVGVMSQNLREWCASIILKNLSRK